MYTLLLTYMYYFRRSSTWRCLLSPPTLRRSRSFFTRICFHVGLFHRSPFEYVRYFWHIYITFDIHALLLTVFYLAPPSLSIDAASLEVSFHTAFCTVGLFYRSLFEYIRYFWRMCITFDGVLLGAAFSLNRHCVIRGLFLHRFFHLGLFHRSLFEYVRYFWHAYVTFEIYICYFWWCSTWRRLLSPSTLRRSRSFSTQIFVA